MYVYVIISYFRAYYLGSYYVIRLSTNRLDIFLFDTGTLYINCQGSYMIKILIKTKFSHSVDGIEIMETKRRTDTQPSNDILKQQERKHAKWNDLDLYFEQKKVLQLYKVAPQLLSNWLPQLERLF